MKSKLDELKRSMEHQIQKLDKDSKKRQVENDNNFRNINKMLQ